MDVIGTRIAGAAKGDHPANGGERGPAEQIGGYSVVQPELRVTVDSNPRGRGSPVVVRVSGEVDIQTSPDLDAHLQQVLNDGAVSVVVDLAGVTFLDSTGLSVLVAALKRCHDVGGTLQVVAPRSHVQRIFEVTGLSDAFGIEALDADEPAPD
jgi:anti-sigma B factor antagonist